MADVPTGIRVTFKGEWSDAAGFSEARGPWYYRSYPTAVKWQMANAGGDTRPQPWFFVEDSARVLAAFPAHDVAAIEYADCLSDVTTER